MSDSTSTKKAIARSLKEICSSRSFDKISVGDIAENAGVNRQTFYYHFQDKFDLIEWIYQTEIFEPYFSEISFKTWDESLTGALKTLRSDSTFYINTIKHNERYVTTFFLDRAEKLFLLAIDAVDEEGRLSDDIRPFFARFFAHGLCGSMIEWIERGMVESPEYIAAGFKELMDSVQQAAIKYPFNTLTDITLELEPIKPQD